MVSIDKTNDSQINLNNERTEGVSFVLNSLYRRISILLSTWEF